jgi:fused signal recognition particle receptor
MNPVAVIVLVSAVVLVVAMVLIGRSIAPPPSESPGGTAPEMAAPQAAVTGLRARLGKSRRALADRLGGAFGRSGLDEEFWNELEDSLVAVDLGIGTATSLVAAVQARQPDDGEHARRILEDELIGMLHDRERAVELGPKPSVMLVVGVNGSGKTTTIGKLASQFRSHGNEVLLGAADTFRAAADQQLRTWAERVGVDIVTGQPGADPASVAFDAFQASRARDVDLLIVDTAGRLQTKANLMAELGKVARVLRREAGDLAEVLLVLDATTGQNAVAQARTFTESVGVTGIVLTKLDGTARGGVVVAVEQELGIPVKYIGVGEGVDDLMPFDPAAFVDALLGA